MVFTPTTLFKGILCPEGEGCFLTNCIFAHDLPSANEAPVRAGDGASATLTSPAQSTDSTPPEPPSKRRKVTYDKLQDKPLSRADVIRGEIAIQRKDAPPPSTSPPLSAGRKLVPSSLGKPVSPPPAANGEVPSPIIPTAGNSMAVDGTTNASNVKAALDGANAVLNPNLIPNDPAGHAKRSLYLKHLYGELARLNNLIKSKIDNNDASAPAIQGAMVLQHDELIKLALAQEEALARDYGNVYANVIKNRIAGYKRATAEEWIAYLKTTPFFASQKSTNRSTQDPGHIDTGLSASEELAVLKQLVVKDQAPLVKYGYIIAPPTAKEATEAAAAVETSANFEVCDRCGARFQMFPQRNEDGLLALGGKCKFHPNRKIYPQKTKADLGPKEPYYPCCNEAVGHVGCTEAEHHVYKTSSPARLHAVCSFVMTPENERPGNAPSGAPVNAVAFDCEMGYTSLGLELIRLTAVSWPSGDPLVDCLVRPFGVVVDLNTRFSGVTAENFTNAVPYDVFRQTHDSRYQSPDQHSGQQQVVTAPLPIVGSVIEARKLLLHYLTPSTPLIGHAIENDLNAVRLCHPAIVDTVIAFPHPRGLPMRYGLKMLASKYLNQSIQSNNAQGHDSLEDARASGNLVRVKVEQKWKLLRAQGWTLKEERLIPPLAVGQKATSDNGGLASKLLTERS